MLYLRGKSNSSIRGEEKRTMGGGRRGGGGGENKNEVRGRNRELRGGNILREKRWNSRIS